MMGLLLYEAILYHEYFYLLLMSKILYMQIIHVLDILHNTSFNVNFFYLFIL
jgi:hypothetical protein